MSKQAASSSTQTDMATEAQRRLGQLPNVFKLAPEGSGISETLWGAAKACYIDNPLPSLFKERLFVALSRFCEVRYCIARHIGFLVGLGAPSGDRDCPPESVEQVEELLRHPLAKGEALEQRLAVLQGLEAPFGCVPRPRTLEEEALLACATHVFLQTQDATRCQAALRQAFDAGSFEHLLMFLSFVRMTHFWTSLHPDLKLEEDVTELLSQHQPLAERVFDESEPAVYRSPESVSEELESLRWDMKQARLMETTLASIGDAVIAADGEGRITVMNVKAEAMTGFLAETAVGKPLAEVFRVCDEAPYGSQGGAELDQWSRGTLVSGDGSRWLIEKCVSPIRGGGSGSVLVFRDISEHLKQEQALEERARLAVLGRDISMALTAEGNVAGMLSRCADTMVERLGVASVQIWTVGESGESLGLVASAGVAIPSRGAASAEALSALTGPEADPSGRGLLSEGCLGVDREWMLGVGLEGFAGVPLVLESRTLGVLALYAKGPVSAATRDALEPVASGLALGISRKQTLDRLRESALRYRLVGDAANDAIWDWDLLGEQVTWNDGVLKTFGYATGDVSVDSAWWLDRIHEEDRDRVSKGIHAAIAGGADHWREEYRFLRADGAYAFVFDRGRVVRDAKGRPVRMVGSMLDVTARKQRERGQAVLAELAARAQPLEDPDEVAGVAVALLAKHFGADRCVYASREGMANLRVRGAFPRMEGLEAEGWALADLGEECERRLRLGELYAVSGMEEGSEPIGGPLSCCRALVCAPVWAHNALAAVLAVGQSEPRQWAPEDTELVRVVAARCAEAMDRAYTQFRLKESEERVRIAVQAAEIGTWDFELATGVMRWSDRCKEVFGLSSEDPIDYGIFLTLLHPEDRDRVDRQVQEAIDPRGKGYYNIDYRVLWPDSAVRWIVATGQAIFRGHGADRKAVRFVGTVLDITDRKESEEQLREAAGRLAEADRRKDEFLATLAHELRNPLAPIRSGLEVLKAAREDADQHEEVRGMMERQTVQLITLVDDLLDVSRVTLGKLELRRSRVEIASVVKSAVEACKPLVEEVGHALTVTLPERPIELNADPNRLAQVISNLLNNAARYTPFGGKMELSVEPKEETVEIVVRDNGIGIPEDKRDHIFELFGQVEGSGESSSLGLGIGLTLVRSLVGMHGGTVAVESEGKGRGSAFRVTLPLESGSAPAAESPAAAERPARKAAPQRVLVVDDNEPAAKMLTLVVKLLGKEVRTAHDGEQAIAMAEEFRPDVMLMDIGMPRMSGDEAARHIRKQAWGKAIFLVALTGWGQDKDRKKTAEAGFDRHLVKPSEPDELKRVLEEAAASRA